MDLNPDENDPIFDYTYAELSACKRQCFDKAVNSYLPFEKVFEFLTTKCNWKPQELIDLMQQRRENIEKKYENLDKVNFYLTPYYKIANLTRSGKYIIVDYILPNLTHVQILMEINYNFGCYSYKDKDENIFWLKPRRNKLKREF